MFEQAKQSLDPKNEPKVLATVLDGVEATNTHGRPQAHQRKDTLCQQTVTQEGLVQLVEYLVDNLKKDWSVQLVEYLVDNLHVR